MIVGSEHWRWHCVGEDGVRAETGVDVGVDAGVNNILSTCDKCHQKNWVTGKFWRPNYAKQKKR